MHKYKYGVLGGTFDHLHDGHKYLLDTAFSLSEKVTIGLAEEVIYKNKFLSYLIDPYKLRERELRNYLKEKKYLSRAEIISLKDIYGPAIKIKNIDAIFVTSATLHNAVSINDERSKKKLPPLVIITIPYKYDESGKIITSERIRQGEINRQGHVFMNIFKEKKVLKLPAGLRNELRRPIGKVLTDITKIKKSNENKSLIIAVGDIVAKSLKELNFPADIEIIDFKTRRQILDKNVFDDYKNKNKIMYFNEAGTIALEAVQIIKDSIDKYLIFNQKPAQKIIIDGEEDLLTLPAILLAPLNSVIYYGQFDLNAMIQVVVTEDIKKLIYSLLCQFE